MSEDNGFTYATVLTIRDVHPMSNPYARGFFSRFLNRLSGWLAHLHKEKSLPIVEMDCPVGNIRCAEDAPYRVSEEQATRDRTIDVLSVNLMFPRR